MPERCEICGETRFETWTYCPACGHPYDEESKSEPGGEPDDEEGDR